MARDANAANNSGAVDPRLANRPFDHASIDRRRLIVLDSRFHRIIDYGKSDLRIRS